MPIFLLLLGCAEPDDSGKETGPATVGTLEAVLDPTALSFGSVPAGAPSTTTFAVVNDGTAEFSITNIVSSAGELTTTYLPSSITPGNSQQITATWSPDLPGRLNATLRVTVDSFDAGSDTLTLPVSGTAGGPTLSLSSTTVSLGSVLVGCGTSMDLTLTNAGDADLEITDAAFLETEDIALHGADDGELPALPWTILPGEGLVVRVAYHPLDVQDVADVLRIRSNDSASPSVDVHVSAAGRAGEAVSLEYPPIREQNVTLLFGVNVVAVSGMFAEPFKTALPTLFETLNETGVHYRAAFVIANDGVVDGHVPYIDETWTPEDASLAAQEMMSAAGGDLDTMFQTLGNAIDQNRSWLLDEDDVWTDAKLNLIGVNNDIEQSSGNYVTWVADYRTYKVDPEDVVVHGIGGDVPRGCTGADPAQAFSDAAGLTGGLFFSICDSDWGSNLAELAIASLGEYQEYTLGNPPLTWTIDVYVDGVAMTTGWDYDDEKNQITFWDGWYPAVGSVVTVEYIAEPECPDAE